MNIAFVANHQKTIFFQAVAEKLESAGHSVYWICPSNRWARWLLGQGAQADRMLDVTESGHLWASGEPLTDKETAALTALEKNSGLKINDLILMDRLLRLKKHDYARKYLAVCGERVHEFLSGRRITCVFSEHTWALELLIAQICTNLGIHSLEPATIRIPDGRFMFINGYKPAEIMEIGEVTPDHRLAAEEFYHKYLESRPKPRYFHLNNKVPRVQADWFPKVFVNLGRARRDPFDETRFTPRWLISRRLTSVIDSRRTFAARPFETPELPPARPFVLVTLHVQPEASIDVCGSFFSNQLELAKTLARSLPVTHDLYIKEHANGIGNRGMDFYAGMKSIPGVRLIDPYVDTFSLLSHADLVAAVSGTVLYEAALLGKPAASMTEMYFGPILLKNGFNPYSESVADLLEAARAVDPEQTGRKQVDFLAWAFAQSSPGMICDPRSDPECMEDENISRVTTGFIKLISSLHACDS